MQGFVICVILVLVSAAWINASPVCKFEIRHNVKRNQVKIN